MGKKITKARKDTRWALVEKDNPLAVHGLFCSEESAKNFLRDTVPYYCEMGFYSDKTLTPESFTTREY